MKKLINLLIIFATISVSAQAVSDYKYISIPEKFSDFDKGQYQLENYLRLLLGQKEYEILPEKRSYWPEEVSLNPCLVLNADIKKMSSAFKNKVMVEFQDCNQTIIGSFEGESNIKEYNEGYKDALKNASLSIAVQAAKMPTYREAENKQVTIVTTTQTENPGTELFKKYSNQNNGNNEEISIQKDKMTAYVFEGQTVYKSDLTEGEFVLMDATKSKTLAYYYPALRANVYHVKVIQGNTNYMTIGYFDGEDLSYEYSADMKTWTLVEFQKK